MTIAPLSVNDELSWEGDHILLGGTSAIRRVMPSGGTPEQLLPLKPGELGWAPHMLPGGDWVLFTASRGRAPEQWAEAQVVAQSISSGERRILVENGRDARYLTSGHLVFARGGVLFAAPLDVNRVELTMPPVPVLDGVRSGATSGTAHFSVSESGTLIYLPGPTGLDGRGARVEVVIANRDGAVERLPLPAGPTAIRAYRRTADGSYSGRQARTRTSGFTTLPDRPLRADSPLAGEIDSRSGPPMAAASPSSRIGMEPRQFTGKPPMAVGLPNA